MAAAARLTVDTSALVETFDACAERFGDVTAVLNAAEHSPLVPATVLCEIGYLAERRYGRRVIDRVLAEFETGGLELDCGERDIGRVRQLIARYDDLPLGSADAFVAACAERNGGRILTLDRRHFDVVGRELGLEVLP